ncbi:integrase [Oscillospiraceae bacterium]|nr:integrase [Oscillospiraceae bacterium]
MSNNLYQNLLAQAEKLRRHNRQGSYKTKERYFQAYQRFLRYLADAYRLEKIANVSGKHLSTYVARMQERGLSASTIKTDLAAIRFWHDQIPGARYTLPSNSEYSLEYRRFGGVDRTWTPAEFHKMLDECRNTHREDYGTCLMIARYAGLRLHEVMRIDTAIARAALKDGFLTIKGKGGKVREVPLDEEVRMVLANYLVGAKPGCKLFVPDGKQTHVAITELQNFIRTHREQVQGNTAKSPLTFHGLRHTCAAEWYRALIADGKSAYDARLQLSKWLGHERDDVTRIYLASEAE